MQNHKRTTPSTPSSECTDLVKIYLHEIGKTPLLTGEEEVLYAQQVAARAAVLKRHETLTKKMGREPSLEEWAESLETTPDKLTQQIKIGEKAYKKMIQANLRLVVSIAKNYLKHRIDFLDLIQEGTLGLERAVEKFDVKKGYKFSTYAYWWIRQAITRAIAEKSRSIRLPVHLSEVGEKLKRAQRVLYKELKRKPSKEELSQEIGEPIEKIDTILLFWKGTTSLDMTVGDDESRTLMDVLEDKQWVEPAKEVENLNRREYLEATISQYLDEREAAVLRMRYGLGDSGEPMTLEAIGNKYNLSRERVRQITAKATKKLRQPHVVAQLQDYKSTLS